MGRQAGEAGQVLQGSLRPSLRLKRDCTGGYSLNSNVMMREDKGRQTTSKSCASQHQLTNADRTQQSFSLWVSTTLLLFIWSLKSLSAFTTFAQTCVEHALPHFPCSSLCAQEVLPETASPDTLMPGQASTASQYHHRYHTSTETEHLTKPPLR